MSSSKRTPASVRYLKARLRALTRPSVIVPTLVLVLSGVFFWEYYTHPEWFEGYDEGNPGPDQSALGQSLSPEEQSIAAEIDNLDVLSNDLILPTVAPQESGEETAQPPPTTSPTAETAGDRFLSSQGQQANPSEAGADGSSANQNPFLFSASTLANGAQGSAGGSGFFGNRSGAATQLNGAGGDPFLFPLGVVNRENATPATLSSSALQQALDQQRLQSSGAPTEPSETAESGSTQPGTSGSAGSESRSSASNPSSSAPTAGAGGLLQPQPVPTSFIRTTPDMSPPPGTTGYTPPSQLYQAPPSAASPNAYTNLVPPQGNFNLPQAPSLVPPQSNFNGSIPTVQGTTPGTGPSSPLSQPFGVDPLAPPSPPPFSAPRRAPGQYTGGGQINTFSNP